MNIGGSTDSTTNAVVANVCGRSDFASCCAAGGRWNLSCVQTGAAYAKQWNLSGGDPCGRYAWAQGPLPGTSQYYPRDFNLFAVSGNVYGLRDTEGPVAASGTVNLSSFHLNIKRREPEALLAQGGASLSNGTVNGIARYAGSYLDSNITYFDAARPTAPSNPFPISFSTVASKLIAMSTALKSYDAIAATRVYNTVTFTGTDPELNVFRSPPRRLQERRATSSTCRRVRIL